MTEERVSILIATQYGRGAILPASIGFACSDRDPNPVIIVNSGRAVTSTRGEFSIRVDGGEIESVGYTWMGVRRVGVNDREFVNKTLGSIENAQERIVIRFSGDSAHTIPVRGSTAGVRRFRDVCVVSR